MERTTAGPKPWQERVSGVVLNGALSNVAAALIVVTGAIYVGMYHVPWAKSLTSHAPTAEQADDTMSVAMAAGTANTAAPASTVASAPTKAAAPPALPDRVAAACGRMERRVYSQVQQPRIRTVAERETTEGNGVPAPTDPRRCHRSTRYIHHSVPFNVA